MFLPAHYLHQLVLLISNSVSPTFSFPAVYTLSFHNDYDLILGLSFNGIHVLTYLIITSGIHHLSFYQLGNRLSKSRGCHFTSSWLYDFLLGLSPLAIVPVF